MQDSKKNYFVGIFFTNPGKEVCKHIPDLKDCEFLKEQYEKELDAGGKGCTACRKKALINKYTSLIKARL